MALFGKSNKRKLRIDSAHRHASNTKGLRVCRFEAMEPRQLLAADIDLITIGSVYYEDESGFDDGGDLIEITFEGGAAGTQLSQIIIDTDKVGDGPTIGDTFFDLAPGGEGAFNSRPLSVESSDGIDSHNISIADGGQLLVIDFIGFDAGEKIVLSLDVDEFGFLGANAVAEGNEWEGTNFSATFVHENYFDATGDDIYLDAYDFKLDGTGLDLPPDNYIPPGNEPAPVRTAGAVFELEQTPLPITIAGTVFEDRNQNNLQNTEDPGIANVQLNLLRLEGGTYVPTGLSTTTDANGDYLFQGPELTPGTYRVVETQPAGYESVGARAGTVDGVTVGSVETVDILTEITLVGGDDSIDNDFAEFIPASIRGRVHVDVDGDCTFDENEQLLEGVTIQLLDSDGNLIATTQTDALGEYVFDGLRAGTYTVVELQPEGYLDGGEKAGSEGGVVTDDRIAEIVLANGTQAVAYDFCEYEPASIAGRVHVDNDGDCLFDEDDPPIAGVTIQLFDNQGNLLATTETDANGEYRFDDLLPGEYTVVELQPAGFFDGGERAGSEGGVVTNDRIAEINLTGGTDAVEYNFCEHEPSSISGRIHADRDGDCDYDEDEPLLAGVTVQLYNANGELVATTETDENGEYLFENLEPGSYTVVELQPEGFFDGGERAGSEGGLVTNDRIAEIVLTSGTSAVNYDFCELEPSSISGRVHADNDGNCVFDPGDTPLEGVTIELLDDTGAVIATTQTNAEGRYLFDNLEPNRTYTVRELQPEGYFDGEEHVGSEGGFVSLQDTITEIFLGPGVAAVNYDFCEIPPSALSGNVFQDGDTLLTVDGQLPANIASLRDGVLTPDDTRLAGVTLELRDGTTGEPILGQDLLPGSYPDGPVRTTTNSAGFYEFTGLPAGDYAVYQVHPDGFIDYLDTPGTLGGTAVNNGVVVNTLTVDPDSDAIVNIPLGVGEVSEQNNFSELRASRIPIIPPEDPDPTPDPDPPARPLIPETPPTILPFLPPPAPEPLALNSGKIVGFTWHLSVVDGGLPRNVDRPDAAIAAFGPRATIDAVAWRRLDLRNSSWLVEDDEAGVKQFQFGLEGAIPVAGDFNGDGIAEIGIFYEGEWFIDINGNGVWDDEDLWAKLGEKYDRPVVGDWDGDGKTDIGIFGPVWPGDPHAIAREPGIPEVLNDRLEVTKNIPPKLEDAALGARHMKRSAEGATRADLIDHVFHFGGPTDSPLSGDWTGDGIATIGTFNNGKWYLDIDGDGRWDSEKDRVHHFGREGDIPVVGDWAGKGKTWIGVYRDGKWILDTNGNGEMDAHDRVFELGAAGDKPVIGDWDGDGQDEVAVYRDGKPVDRQAAAESSDTTVR